MKDLNCPYCEHPQNINHDDGYGTEEDEIYEQQCGNCEKIFTYTTSILFSYTPQKAPCLNGAAHNFKKVIHTPEHSPDWVICDCCGKEKGKDYVCWD